MVDQFVGIVPLLPILRAFIMKLTSSTLIFAALALVMQMPAAAQQQQYVVAPTFVPFYFFPSYATYPVAPELADEEVDVTDDSNVEQAHWVADESELATITADICTGGHDCTASHCDAGCHCPRCGPNGLWVNAEYLMWFPKGRSLPALVTTSPNGTNRDDAGVLGLPDTSILFGDETIGNQLKSGGRIDFGTWLNQYRTVGAGGRFYGIQGDNTSYVDSSNGQPIIAHPFFNLALNREDSLLVAFSDTVNVPNEFVTSGSTSIRTSSDFLGAEAYFRIFGQRNRNFQFDVIGGYHFLRLDDGLTISDGIVSGPDNGLVPLGTVFQIDDVFDATNVFHGGQLGILGEYRRGSVSLNFLTKFSIGNMQQIVRIDGSTVIAEPGLPSVTSAGGLYTQPSNIDTHQRDKTAFVPEFGITLGYDLTCRLKATLGYSLIWWNDVALAGDQIDPVINLTQAQGGVLVGDARPEFTFNTTDYWVQGLNFGLVYQY